MTAGLGYRAAGHQQAWPREGTLFERPAQPGISATGVVYGREPPLEHFGQRPRRQYGNLAFEASAGLELDVHVHCGGMNVRVDQARQQRAAIDVDDSGPGASRRAPVENIDDDAVVDRYTTLERRVARSRDDHPVGELQGLAHPLIPIGEDSDRQVLDSPWALATIVRGSGRPDICFSR